MAIGMAEGMVAVRARLRVVMIRADCIIDYLMVFVVLL